MQSQKAGFIQLCRKHLFIARDLNTKIPSFLKEFTVSLEIRQVTSDKVYDHHLLHGDQGKVLWALGRKRGAQTGGEERLQLRAEGRIEAHSRNKPKDSHSRQKSRKCAHHGGRCGRASIKSFTFLECTVGGDHQAELTEQQGLM